MSKRKDMKRYGKKLISSISQCLLATGSGIFLGSDGAGLGDNDMIGAGRCHSNINLLCFGACLGDFDVVGLGASLGNINVLCFGAGLGNFDVIGLGASFGDINVLCFGASLGNFDMIGAGRGLGDVVGYCAGDRDDDLVLSALHDSARNEERGQEDSCKDRETHVD